LVYKTTKASKNWQGFPLKVSLTRYKNVVGTSFFIFCNLWMFKVVWHYGRVELPNVQVSDTTDDE
jgi:hypothetical protein